LMKNIFTTLPQGMRLSGALCFRGNTLSSSPLFPSAK
jgi:hypothetical protein